MLPILAGAAVLAGGVWAYRRFKGNRLQQPPKRPLALEPILDKVRDTIDAVHAVSDEHHLPQLLYVDVVLLYQIRISANNRVSYAVVTVGSNTTKYATQAMQIRLRPTHRCTTYPPRDNAEVGLLAGAIIDTAKALDQVRAREPQLDLAGMSATVEFTVTAGIDGRAGFSFVPVSDATGASYRGANAHRVTMVYGMAGT